MEQKTEASQAVDEPMPLGVEKMTKQELWNWFSRSQRAAAEKKYLEEKFFTVTTGLHSARLCGNPYEIIETQRKRMAGLEMQMAQMQKGYERKLKQALKAQPAPTEAAQGSFLVRVTPMNPEYVDVHPELALEDALRVNPHGWPDGFQFEVVTQGAQLSGNPGELENKQVLENIEQVQGEDSARLDAEPGPWVVLVEDADIDYMRLLDVVLSNGVYLMGCKWGELDWTQVRDWRYSGARASAETGGVKS